MSVLTREAGSPVAEVFAPPVLTRMLSAGGANSIDVLEACVPVTMTAYRELDSLQAGFGVSDADRIDRGPHRIPGYTVLSHSRCLEGGDWEAGAVLECTIPQGTQALWLAGYGDPCTFAGADLLLLRDAIVEVGGVRADGDVDVIEAVVAGASRHPERHRPSVIARPDLRVSRKPSQPSRPGAR